MASIVFDREDADDQVLAQALYVNEADLGDEDTDQEQPPASGEEYLRQVVRQANKLQFATTAENADQLLNQVQVNLFQKHLFLYQLTHNTYGKSFFIE